MVKHRSSPPRQATAKGAKILSATLENKHVFRTAKGSGPRPPAVLVLRRRPDFDKADFDRKARDLVRLGQEGKLKKATSDRNTEKVYDRNTRKMLTRSKIYRERMIRKLERKYGRDPSALPKLDDTAKNALYRLKVGKGSVTEAGEGLDADHIQDLQVGGKDAYDNLRLMDSWTNRELGREIGNALRSVPEGTKIIVKVIP
jgi:hypothetical protein